MLKRVGVGVGGGLVLTMVLTIVFLGGCTRALGSFERGVCGNGEAEPGYGEQCDDGNHTPGDGCNPACRIE